MFRDARSKRVLLVAHCVLNQNAKLDRCAHYPGVVSGVTQLLVNAGIGLLQMPCPELMCLGLGRHAEQGTTATVEAEDTRIAERMSQADARSICQRLVEDLVYQVREYRQHGFEIAGLVGVNGSPSCGVETTWCDDQEHAGPGTFIEMLQAEFECGGVPIPMRGIKAYQPDRALSAVTELLQRAQAWS